MMQDFVDYLKDRKRELLAEWAEKLCSMGPARKKIDPRELEEPSSAVFDAICLCIEKDDFEPLRSLLGEMIPARLFPEIFFMESQQAFSTLRNILFPLIIERYERDDLLQVLSCVNRSIDMIIIHFCNYIGKRHADKLKTYTGKLEEEVKKRTLELEESRKNYKILFEEISDGCFVNQEGRIVFANKPFCEMHGYQRDEIIGKKCENLIADDSREKVMQRFYRYLKGEIPIETFIYCRQDKKGQLFPTENRVKLIQYNGKPAVLGLCTDITERLEMEEKIRQKDRLALIGSLTTSIAHEIRNPLSAIKMNLQLLLSRMNLEGNDLRRLQIANEQSAHMEGILSQMMDFAKPLKLGYHPTSPYEVIDRAIQLVEGRIREEDIVLIKQLDPDLPDVMVDRERILEALTNILRNASEAFNGQSREKRIELKAGIGMYHAKNYFRLSISDNGVGILPEDKDKIFDPFFTKGKKDGIGLGLPIVKKIVEAHYGRIRVTSEPNMGASFSMMIPFDISQQAL